jgi:hypothetical protein
MELHRHSFLTSPLDGGMSRQLHAPVRFTPGKGLSVSIGWEAGWAL